MILASFQRENQALRSFWFFGQSSQPFSVNKAIKLNYKKFSWVNFRWELIYLSRRLIKKLNLNVFKALLSPHVKCKVRAQFIQGGGNLWRTPSCVSKLPKGLNYIVSSMDMAAQKSQTGFQDICLNNLSTNPILNRKIMPKHSQILSRKSIKFCDHKSVRLN